MTPGGGPDEQAVQLDVDDLLPIVEAAQLLGFARALEGDVEVTEEGRAFAAGDIEKQKALFREASLRDIAHGFRAGDQI